MENKEKKTFGFIDEKLRLVQFVGDGNTSAGQDFELCVGTSLNPIVRFGKKSFVLPWEDILSLAELAGLFKKDGE